MMRKMEDKDIASTKSITNAPSFSNVSDIKVINEPQRRVTQTATPEEFPEFPRSRMENDNSPMLDEVASIATSVEDEAVFDYTEMTSDDPFGLPEYADEAITIDEPTINDRTFRHTMAKQANLFMVTLENIKLAGSVANDNLQIDGYLTKIELGEKLGILRNEINELMRKPGDELVRVPNMPPFHAAAFKFLSPANEKISHVTVDVNQLKATIDDEIITHLGAFAKDDFVTDNRLRLAIHVHDSCIQIVDRKKKKPLRLKIKALSIEQDED
uniref:Zpr1 domain-containing protein n=1 Tax=Caenorhabditis tropicalis TaxID=1561998 RepID=A0A1I7TN31_9PELO